MFTVEASHKTSFKSNLIFRKSDINSCEKTNNSDHCMDKIFEKWRKGHRQEWLLLATEWPTILLI